MAVINLGLTANSSTPLYDPAYPDGDRSASLSAPANFAAVAGDTVVDLSWNVVATATDYEVRVDAGSWVSTSNTLSHQFTGLTNTTEYDFDVRATTSGEDGPLSSTASTPVAAVGLVWSQNFEANMTGVTAGGTPDSIARVTSNPHSGSYSLRGNLKDSASDPLTGKSGNNFTADIVPSGLRAATPNTCYLSYWFRFDNCDWGTDPDFKFGYFSDTSSEAITNNAIWPAIQPDNKMVVVFYNGLTGDMPTWPAGVVYLSNTGHTTLTVGTWHKYEMEFDYTANVFRMWVNGVQYKGSSYFTDGNFDIPSDFRLDAWRQFYSTDSKMTVVTDANGEYAAGWQIDDIQIYDEVPA